MMWAWEAHERRGNPRFGARGLKSGPAHSGTSALDGATGLAVLFAFFMVFRVGGVAETVAGSGVSTYGQSSLPPRAVVYGKG